MILNIAWQQLYAWSLKVHQESLEYTLNKFWHLLFIKMKNLIIHMLCPGYTKKVLKVQEMKLQGIKIKKQGRYLVYLKTII